MGNSTCWDCRNEAYGKVEWSSQEEERAFLLPAVQGAFVSSQVEQRAAYVHEEEEGGRGEAGGCSKWRTP